MSVNIAASAWFALGADLDITKEDNEEVAQFQQSIQNFMKSLEYMSSAIPLYKIYPTKQYKETKQYVTAVRSLGRRYMERNRENIERRVKEGGNTDGLSLIEQWMIEGKMSEERCIGSAVAMFGAGVDTVSKTTKTNYN